MLSTPSKSANTTFLADADVLSGCGLGAELADTSRPKRGKWQGALTITLCDCPPTFRRQTSVTLYDGDWRGSGPEDVASQEQNTTQQRGKPELSGPQAPSQSAREGERRPPTQAARRRPGSHEQSQASEPREGRNPDPAPKKPCRAGSEAQKTERK